MIFHSWSESITMKSTEIKYQYSMVDNQYTFFALLNRFLRIENCLCYVTLNLTLMVKILDSTFWQIQTIKEFLTKNICLCAMQWCFQIFCVRMVHFFLQAMSNRLSLFVNAHQLKCGKKKNRFEIFLPRMMLHMNAPFNI